MHLSIRIEDVVHDCSKDGIDEWMNALTIFVFLIYDTITHQFLSTQVHVYLKNAKSKEIANDESKQKEEKGR